MRIFISNKFHNLLKTKSLLRFPGGALFLFEGKDEKTIIHAGDFRLPTELESHELLINNTNIDKIQFDTS